MACLQIQRELLSLATFLRVHSTSKEVSYLSWQNMYPNLKATCRIMLKFFLWTKLLESLLLAKYLISVVASLSPFPTAFFSKLQHTAEVNKNHWRVFWEELLNFCFEYLFWIFQTFLNTSVEEFFSKNFFGCLVNYQISSSAKFFVQRLLTRPW